MLQHWPLLRCCRRKAAKAAMASSSSDQPFNLSNSRAIQASISKQQGDSSRQGRLESRHPPTEGRRHSRRTPSTRQPQPTAITRSTADWQLQSAITPLSHHSAAASHPLLPVALIASQRHRRIGQQSADQPNSASASAAAAAASHPTIERTVKLVRATSRPQVEGAEGEPSATAAEGQQEAAAALMTCCERRRLNQLQPSSHPTLPVALTLCCCRLLLQPQPPLRSPGLTRHTRDELSCWYQPAGSQGDRAADVVTMASVAAHQLGCTHR